MPATQYSDDSLVFRCAHKWKPHASQLFPASTEIIVKAKNYLAIGLHPKDVLHCACAVSVKANYFVTTDKQLIKATRQLSQLKVVNPLTFIQEEASP